MQLITGGKADLFGVAMKSDAVANERRSEFLEIIERRIDSLSEKCGTARTASTCLVRGIVENAFKEQAISESELRAFRARLTGTINS